MWVFKYAPQTLREVAGNAQQIANLTKWLKQFAKSKTKLHALIIGPNGIGKTITASLLAKSLNYELIEQNAVDIRTSAQITDLLRPFTKSRNQQTAITNKKHIIIMDEADTLSSGDTGGMRALTTYIQLSTVPFIFIATDKQKVAPLKKFCQVFKFTPPRPIELHKLILKIATTEHFTISPNALEKLYITSARGDVRQLINNLQMITLTNKKITSKSLSLSPSAQNALTDKQYYSTFDVVPHLFSQANSTAEKIELFFTDYSLIPLFVQENYLSARPKTCRNVEDAFLSADAISAGDIINTQLHSAAGGEWSALLEIYGYVSVATPCFYASPKSALKFAAFPQSLGKYSSISKTHSTISSLMRKLTRPQQNHLCLIEMRKILYSRLFMPICERGVDGFEKVIAFMRSYELSKEDYDFICYEFGIVKCDKTLIAPAIKSKFTKQLKKKN